MLTIQCPQCGIAFKVQAWRRDTAKFCSQKCRGIYLKAGEDRICKICGNSFYAERRRVLKGLGLYCSHKCSSKASIRQTERICEICGEHFTAIPSKAKNGRGRYCSIKCRGQGHSKTMRGENATNWKGGPAKVSCAECGNTYLTTVAKVKNNSTKFCSCVCYGLWRRRHIVGENNPAWKGGQSHYYGLNWSSQKRKVLKRDEYTCQRCNITETDYGQSLSVHHIIPLREFNYIPRENDNYKEANKLSNLVALCAPCHHTVEWRGMEC